MSYPFAALLGECEVLHRAYRLRILNLRREVRRERGMRSAHHRRRLVLTDQPTLTRSPNASLFYAFSTQLTLAHSRLALSPRGLLGLDDKRAHLRARSPAHHLVCRLLRWVITEAARSSAD